MKNNLPKHLSPSARSWVRGILKIFEIPKGDHLFKILISAAEVLDRLTECREKIKKDGAFYVDRFGSPKAHPALLEERNHRVTFARLVRELNLSEGPAESRPPGLQYEE
jgi:hypothetical protein